MGSPGVIFRYSKILPQDQFFLAIPNNVEFEFDVEKWFSLQSSTKLKMAKKELVLGQNFWISKNDPWWPHLM